MLSDVDAFVRFEPPESFEAPAHLIVLMEALDPAHAEALVGDRLQDNFDIWKHFAVHRRVPDTAPGPSPLFSYG